MKRYWHMLRDHVVRILTSPGEELGRGARFVRYQIRLFYFCMRRLKQHNAMAMSSALSFRSVFAMIPLIVLGVVAMKSFGYLEEGKAKLRDLLDESGFSQITLSGGAEVTTAPASQPGTRPASPPTTAPGGADDRVVNVAAQIEQIVDSVEQKLTFGALGPVGAALLIWSALTLVTTMERSLNRIFGAPRPRGLGRRVLLYWSACTLGPIAVVLAEVASVKAMAFFDKIGGWSWILAAVGWVQPILVGVVVLTALYVLMPNTTVSLRAALGAAAVAFPLWLIARWGYSIYLQRLVGKDNLYGSLGLLPLTLLWLNLSWYLFLFGAELAHTAASLGDLSFADRGEPSVLSPWDLLGAAVAVAGRHAAGQEPPTAEHLAGRLGLPAPAAQTLLDRLTEGGVVCAVARDGPAAYVPARTADRIRVVDVLEFADPPKGRKASSRLDAALGRAVREARSAAAGALDEMTVSDLLPPGPTA